MDDLQQYVLDQPLHTQAFFTLVEATANLVAISEKYWQSKGISGARIRVLVEIAKQGGTILPSVLAHKIGVTKANISLLLTPLEKDGYIIRASDTLDGRKSVISITSAGQQLLMEHLPNNRQTVAEGMKGLNVQELQLLISLLQKLNRG
ncbi:MarR family winged helix-turn-helix transcriptional regulator [Paenibacillus monticola]|uniref:MarR family transcriptional regulator n=1 Tax=Paenibacillus monticola TaxID=2666075 RepID=A0A7X2H7Z4_9BACL|nr:MarR family winged helix-turn-helix transcriptional regulator [Paenibacillus monticola]MRN55123.1 MarR family transcriptional regulator [Paenibacillus monticola]